MTANGRTFTAPAPGARPAPTFEGGRGRCGPSARRRLYLVTEPAKLMTDSLGAG